MKNFLIFYGDIYYPSGGMEDFLGSCDTIEEAEEIIYKINNGNQFTFTWGHIFSLSENKIVKEY